MRNRRVALRSASLFTVNYCADDGEDAYGETGINARQRHVNLSRQTFPSQTPPPRCTERIIIYSLTIQSIYVIQIYLNGPVVFISSFRPRSFAFTKIPSG